MKKKTGKEIPGYVLCRDCQRGRGGDQSCAAGLMAAANSKTSGCFSGKKKEVVVAPL